MSDASDNDGPPPPVQATVFDGDSLIGRGRGRGSRSGSSSGTGVVGGRGRGGDFGASSYKRRPFDLMREEMDARSRLFNGESDPLGRVESVHASAIGAGSSRNDFEPENNGCFEVDSENSSGDEDWDGPRASADPSSNTRDLCDTLGINEEDLDVDASEAAQAEDESYNFDSRQTRGVRSRETQDSLLSELARLAKRSRMAGFSVEGVGGEQEQCADGSDEAPFRRRRSHRTREVAPYSGRANVTSHQDDRDNFHSNSEDRAQDEAECDDDEYEEGGIERERRRRNSERARRAAAEKERLFFDVPGVQCVGCNLDVRVTNDVDRFVSENYARKQPFALWRMASLYYDRKWRIPSEREGMFAPRWFAEDIQLHYEHHCISTRLARTDMCRGLRGLRNVMLMRMLREDASGTGDSFETDKTSVENYLKIVAAESREHDRLQALDAPARGGKGPSAGSSYVPIKKNTEEENE